MLGPRQFVAGALIAILAASSAGASDLVYQPVSPSFGGSPLNGSYVLGLAGANNYKFNESPQAKQQRAEQQQQLGGTSATDQFARQITASLLSQIASTVGQQIVGENARDSGRFSIGGTSVVFNRIGGQINIDITDGSSGGRTNIQNSGPAVLGATRGRVMTFRVALALGASLVALSACGTAPARMIAEKPTLGVRTENTNELRALPAPARKVDVAVFNFTDQTGQHRPNTNFAEYSFAVTQGGASILIKALQDAGRNSWFNVLERNRLADLLQERQIIRANRSEYVGPGGQPLPPIAPLRKPASCSRVASSPTTATC